MTDTVNLGHGSFGNVMVYKTNEHKGIRTNPEIDDPEVHPEGSLAIKRRKNKSTKDVILREADVMGRLGPHPHVVELQSLIIDGRKLSLVMKRADSDLFDLIEDGNISNVKLIYVGILLGLEHIHNQGFIHRDIKPENILIADDEHAMIADLDFCTTHYGKRHRLTPRVGTAQFLSPEIASRRGIYTSATDVWSLACMMYGTFCESELMNEKAYRVSQLLVCPNYPSKALVKALGHVDEEFLTHYDNNVKREYLTPVRRIEEYGDIGKALQLFDSRDNLNKVMESMLQYDYRKRPSVSQILDNSMFDEYRSYIDKVRKQYGMRKIIVLDDFYPCTEELKSIKSNFIQFIDSALNNCKKIHLAETATILNQAIVNFHRAVIVMREVRKEDVLSRSDAGMCMLTGIVLSQRYYEEELVPMKYEDIAPHSKHNKESKLLLLKIERALIREHGEGSLTCTTRISQLRSKYEDKDLTMDMLRDALHSYFE